jgi:hypothetical protein
MGHWIKNQNKPIVTGYLSENGQKELIAIVGTKVGQKIVAEFNEANFFVDKTPTVSHEERFTVGVWYIDREGVARECLLSVVDFESRIGADIAEEITRV